ncbi:MAG TPA: recombinase family protein [Candidatus Saccharimonadales bacterium]|nr:recombinase family protein [Candidatus Saccharimonadales bacterium]
MRKAVLLARVSTKRQEDEGLSLEEIQLPEMREYAELHDFEVVKEYVFSESADRGIRLKFNEMMDFVKKNKDVEAVIAFRVDRATRNFADAVMMDNLRLEYDKELHFVHDRLVITKQSVGRDITDWDTKVYLAKQLINRLKEDAHNTRYSKLRDGELPGIAPYGYKNETLDKRNKTVTVVPFKSNIALKAFELYSTGTFSYKSLAKRMKQDYGVHMPWSSFGTILKNRFYVGEIYDKATDAYFPHEYEQFIPYELFWQVQDVIEGHGKKKIKYAGLPFTYRGLMHCKTCGCAITPEQKTKKQKNGNEHHYAYYHCTGKRGKHKDMAWLEEKDLDKILGQLFDECKIPESELPRLEQTLKEAHGGKVKFNREQVGYYNNEIAKLQKRIEAAYEDKCDGSITQAEYDKVRAKWRQKQKFAERKLARLSQTDEQYYITVTYLLEIAARGKELFEHAEPNEKRELIGLLGQNLFLDGNQVQITLYKPFSDIASCLDGSVWLRGLDSNWVLLPPEF